MKLPYLFSVRQYYFSPKEKPTKPDHKTIGHTRTNTLNKHDRIGEKTQKSGHRQLYCKARPMIFT